MSTFISRKLKFEQSVTGIDSEAYINDEGDIWIGDEDNTMQFVCIKKEDWNDIVKFIASEYKKLS